MTEQAANLLATLRAELREARCGDPDYPCQYHQGQSDLAGEVLAQLDRLEDELLHG